MGLRVCVLAAICVVTLVGCGSESQPSPATDASGGRNGEPASHQYDTAGGSGGDQGASRRGGNPGGDASGGRIAGGDIAGGMRVPDGPNREGSQRPAASGGARPESPNRQASGDSGNTAGTPVIPDKLAADMAMPQYVEFRGMCRTLFALRDEMQPLEHALAVGSATPAQVDRFNDLDADARREQQRLNVYMWQDRWTADDRRVMAMIMYLR